MQQQKDDVMNWKRNFNIAFWLCLVHQRCLTVLMRNRFGVQALGTSCFFALALMFLWATFTRDPLMWLWLGIWLLCFIRRRIEALKLVWNGARVHSHYDGWPFDAIRLGKTEKAAKLVVEPLLVALLGGILYWIYGELEWPTNGLPRFLMTGVFTLPLVESVKQTIWQKRTQDMLDARIEQEAVLRDFRNKYGE